MKKFKILFITIIVIIGSLGLKLNAQVLNVPLVIQEQTNWCWSASSKCVLDYYSFINAQCTIADYTRTVATWHNFGSVNCCADPSQGCNYSNYMWGSSGSIEDILIHFGNIYDNEISTYLSIPQIQTEASAGRPFIFRWGWYSGGGHFMVGQGISGTDMYYMNPLPGYGYEISNYNWVVDDGSTHTWTHTLTLCLPAIPGSISGNTNVCQGSSQTYSVSPVSGATSYTWTLPPSWSGSSTSNSITTIAGSSGGTISVTANNTCGSSVAQTLAVTVNPVPAEPGSISGNLDVCQGSSQVYSISPVSGATSYTWTLPSDWSGSSTTTSITAVVGSLSGTVSVTANNTCGSSTAQSLFVPVYSVDTSVTINGSTLISNANPATYQWVRCPSMQLINGETNQTFSPSQDGSYAVIVNQNSCIDTSGCHTVTLTDITYNDNKISIVIYPNPTKNKCKVQCAKCNIKRIEIFNLTGEMVYGADFSSGIGDSIEVGFDLPAGVYFVKVSSDNFVEVRKLVKE